MQSGSKESSYFLGISYGKYELSFEPLCMMRFNTFVISHNKNFSQYLFSSHNFHFTRANKPRFESILQKLLESHFQRCANIRANTSLLTVTRIILQVFEWLKSWIILLQMSSRNRAIFITSLHSQTLRQYYTPSSVIWALIVRVVVRRSDVVISKFFRLRNEKWKIQKLYTLSKISNLERLTL